MDAMLHHLLKVKPTILLILLLWVAAGSMSAEAGVWHTVRSIPEYKRQFEQLRQQYVDLRREIAEIQDQLDYLSAQIEANTSTLLKLQELAELQRKDWLSLLQEDRDAISRQLTEVWLEPPPPWSSSANHSIEVPEPIDRARFWNRAAIWWDRIQFMRAEVEKAERIRTDLQYNIKQAEFIIQDLERERAQWQKRLIELFRSFDSLLD